MASHPVPICSPPAVFLWVPCASEWGLRETMTPQSWWASRPPSLGLLWKAFHWPVLPLRTHGAGGSGQDCPSAATHKGCMGDMAGLS